MKNKQKAADLISEFFRLTHQARPRMGEDALAVSHVARRALVDTYRLLTGEMPQSPGIEEEYWSDEVPALEWASASSRDPNEIFEVVVDQMGHEPDILIPQAEHQLRLGDGKGRK